MFYVVKEGGRSASKLRFSGPATPPFGRLVVLNMEVIFMTGKSSLFKQSGRRDLPESERRKHSVNVRFNTQELSDLDAVRGKSRRAEALRLLAFSHFPAPIPPVNADLRADLGRALGNLSTASTAMRAGEYIEVRDLVLQLRSKLGGAL